MRGLNGEATSKQAEAVRPRVKRLGGRRGGENVEPFRSGPRGENRENDGNWGSVAKSRAFAPFGSEKASKRSAFLKFRRQIDVFGGVFPPFCLSAIFGGGKSAFSTTFFDDGEAISDNDFRRRKSRLVRRHFSAAANRRFQAMIFEGGKSAISDDVFRRRRNNFRRRCFRRRQVAFGSSTFFSGGKSAISGETFFRRRFHRRFSALIFGGGVKASIAARGASGAESAILTAARKRKKPKSRLDFPNRTRNAKNRFQKFGELGGRFGNGARENKRER